MGDVVRKKKIIFGKDKGEHVGNVERKKLKSLDGRGASMVK
jgi:hypothetical protein